MKVIIFNILCHVLRKNIHILPQKTFFVHLYYSNSSCHLIPLIYNLLELEIFSETTAMLY